jgi:hypothetical protein
MHILINSILNKEELPQHWKAFITLFGPKMEEVTGRLEKTA